MGMSEIAVFPLAFQRDLQQQFSQQEFRLHMLLRFGESRGVLQFGKDLMERIVFRDGIEIVLSGKVAEKGGEDCLVNADKFQYLLLQLKNLQMGLWFYH